MCNKACPVDRCRSIFLQEPQCVLQSHTLYWMQNHIPAVVLSYSTIRRSLVTFATILAAAIEALLASPFMIGTCGISTPGIVTASFRRSCGATFKLAYCLTHGFIGCLQNIDLVNSSPVRPCLVPTATASRKNHVIQFFSFMCCKLLRIIQI